MSSIAELMQLCRLCLVKDQVDVPIFEDSGDLHERCLKIAACLPVKVKKDDKLPKKICSGCSYKLDLLYQFYNTSASADKQLKTWLSQLEGGKTIEGEVSSKESLTKSEPSESGDAHSLSADAESYIMQQQKLPYQNVAFPFQEDAFVEPQPSSSGLAEETETRTPSKRKRKTIQTLPVPDSDEEDDPHSKIAKLENDSDSDNDNDNDNFIPDDTSDSEQPGPSGLGKVSGDTPFEFISTDPSIEVKTEPILESDIDDETFGISEEFSSYAPEINKFSLLNDHSYSLVEKTSKPNVVIRGTLRVVSKNDLLKRKTNKLILNQSKVKDDTEKINNPKEKIFTCDICQETFEEKIALAGHRLIHNQPYVCSHCNREFKSDKIYERHLLVHTKEGYQPCQYCNQQFFVQDALKRHEEICFQGGYYCDLCNQLFKSKYSLKKHKETVHEKSQFPCEICKKSFTTLQYYKRHLVIHSPTYKKFVPCKICNKEIGARFVSKHMRNYHSQHEKKQYICQVCGKSLTSITSLKSHLTLHEDNTKSFVCNRCGKAFGQMKNLRFHISTVHERTREHVCLICDSKFTQRSSLTIHMRKHTGERPFECTLCPKKFITKTVMGYHMKKAHKIADN